MWKTLDYTGFAIVSQIFLELVAHFHDTKPNSICLSSRVVSFICLQFHFLPEFLSPTSVLKQSKLDTALQLRTWQRYTEKRQLHMFHIWLFCAFVNFAFFHPSLTALASTPFSFQYISQMLFCRKAACRVLPIFCLLTDNSYKRVLRFFMNCSLICASRSWQVSINYQLFLSLLPLGCLSMSKNNPVE